MGEHESAEVEPGTVFAAGQPAPPTTTHKANAGLLYSLGPVLLGAVVELLDNAGTLWPDGPPWFLHTVAALLVVLGPVAAYFGVRATANLLLQPVIVAGPDLGAMPAPGVDPR